MLQAINTSKSKLINIIMIEMPNGAISLLFSAKGFVP